MAAELSVTRGRDAWRDRLRSYQLIVDGDERGSVRRGETTTLSVSAGRHDLRMKIDWCGSQTIEVELQDGDRAYVACRSGVSLLVLPLYVTVWRNRYIELQLTGIERAADTSASKAVPARGP